MKPKQVPHGAASEQGFHGLQPNSMEHPMSINWYRVLRPVLLLPLMAALGCGKGYPTEDVLPPSAAAEQLAGVVHAETQKFP